MAQGSPNFAINPIRGAGTVQIGDSSRTLPTNPVTILTAGTSGSRIERIVLEAIGPTIASVLRLWFYDGANYHLWNEISIGSQTPSAGAALGASTLEAVTSPNLIPELLPAGWSLRASINDTQLASEINPASIAISQTLGAAGYLSLNGTSVTLASATAVAAAQAPAANTPLTLAAAPFVNGTPFVPTLTSTSNLSAVNFFVIGRDATGAIITETVAGPNNTTVYAANVYKALLAIIPLSTNAGTVSIGTSPVAGSSIFTLPSKIMLLSGGNLSAVNFTITGMTTGGVKQTETLAGPNVNEVLSANSYTGIFSILASAAVGSAVQVGNPAMLSGIKVHGIGGNF
jgi:hypothetical protein